MVVLGGKYETGGMWGGQRERYKESKGRSLVQNLTSSITHRGGRENRHHATVFGEAKATNKRQQSQKHRRGKIQRRHGVGGTKRRCSCTQNESLLNDMSNQRQKGSSKQGSAEEGGMVRTRDKDRSRAAKVG